MIPLMQEEVIRNGWMTMPELIDFIAISESTPGPFAVNVATFVGTRVQGPAGAVFSTLGIIMPSFLIILFIAKLFIGFKDNRYVKSALYGARPAVVGLIAAAVISIAKNALLIKDVNLNFWQSINIPGVIIFIAVLSAQLWKKLKPVQLILLSALLGLVVCGGSALLGF